MKDYVAIGIGFAIFALVIVYPRILLFVFVGVSLFIVTILWALVGVAIVDWATGNQDRWRDK